MHQNVKRNEWIKNLPSSSELLRISSRFCMEHLTCDHSPNSPYFKKKCQVFYYNMIIWMYQLLIYLILSYGFLWFLRICLVWFFMVLEVSASVQLKTCLHFFLPWIQVGCMIWKIWQVDRHWQGLFLTISYDFKWVQKRHKKNIELGNFRQI